MKRLLCSKPIVNEYIDSNYSDALKSDPVLILFLNAFKDINNYKVETSCKVLDNKIHNTRLNFLFFKKECDLNQVYNRVILLFNQINLLKNYKVNYNETIEKMDTRELDNIIVLGVGFDLYDSNEKSRIKIWTEFINVPKFQYKIINEFGYNKELLNLIINNDIIVGFDYYLDGKFALKLHFLYYDFKSNPVMQLKLSQFFSENIIEAMRLSDQFALSYKRSSFKKILYFFHSDMDRIIEILKIKNIFPDFYFGSDKKPSGICFFVDDLGKDRFNEYNIYFTLE